MAPVFSLVLDRDLNEDLALSYPELYKELTKVRCARLPIIAIIVCHMQTSSQGRALSYKTFFIWLMISLYQGRSPVFVLAKNKRMK